jgi:hypothetical protein
VPNIVRGDGPPRRDPRVPPDYIDAEFREVEPAPLVVPCPHCGRDASPLFGTCYFCMRPLAPARRPTKWEEIKTLWREVGRINNWW